LFDGHDAAINLIRRLLQAEGAEVVHLGHNRSVADIVRAAIDEDADGIAVSSYQGGHNEYFTYMVDMLRERGCEHIRVVIGGGGTIAPHEIEALERHGIEKIYTPEDGRTLGLVGFGRIGQAVARRAIGFGMRVLYASRSEAPAAVEQELRAQRVPLDLLLKQSDFVSLHVPLRDETRHLIGVEQLCQMKRTAFLINTARGPVVDERALVAALEENLIAGAGLDVFEAEPTVSPGLLQLPNVVLLPHVGSAVTSVRSLMCALAANDCVALLTGEQPKHPVNAEVLRPRAHGPQGHEPQAPGPQDRGLRGQG
jgi:methylmalonyl-CoA mutase cobalamin-binding domain/chain